MSLRHWSATCAILYRCYPSWTIWTCLTCHLASRHALVLSSRHHNRLLYVLCILEVINLTRLSKSSCLDFWVSKKASLKLALKCKQMWQLMSSNRHLVLRCRLMERIAKPIQHLNQPKADKSQSQPTLLKREKASLVVTWWRLLQWQT